MSIRVRSALVTTVNNIDERMGILRDMVHIVKHGFELHVGLAVRLDFCEGL